MKKLNFIVLLASAAALLASCNGSSTNGNNTSEGNYVKRPILPGNNRFAAVAFTIGDSVAYVGTGFDGINSDSLDNDFYRYNVDSATWFTQVASAPVRRYMAVAFSVDGKGYVGTGLDNKLKVYYKDFYSYDPATNTWHTIAPLPASAAPRARATAFGLDNVHKGYVVGGATSNSIFLSDVYSYDPTTDSWTEDQGLPFDRRAGASSFVLDGKGYVLGGYDGNSLSPYFYQYDPSKASHWITQRQITTATDSSFDDTWTTIERVDGVAMVIGSKVYYATGASSSGDAYGAGIGSPNMTTWCWDPTTDVWEQRSNYERSGRWQAVGFSLKSRGFVGTGYTGGLAQNNFDEFIPSQDLNLND